WQTATRIYGRFC
ncbi:transketolase, thiamine diphosphate binding domain protein, partial [Vibrio cholerae HC-62B1]